MHWIFSRFFVNYCQTSSEVCDFYITFILKMREPGLGQLKETSPKSQSTEIVDKIRSQIGLPTLMPESFIVAQRFPTPLSELFGTGRDRQCYFPMTGWVNFLPREQKLPPPLCRIQRTMSGYCNGTRLSRGTGQPCRIPVLIICI